jgi:hypothetical protein
MACAQRSFASFGGRRSISDTGRLHANRAKGGCANVHPLHGPELRALRPLLRRFSPLKCRWQLKHSGVLSLFQQCQQNNPAIRKFQGIVMSRRPIPLISREIAVL